MTRLPVHFPTELEAFQCDQRPASEQAATDPLFSVILLSSGNVMPADPDQDPAPQWTLDLDYIVLLPEQQDCVLWGAGGGRDAHSSEQLSHPHQDPTGDRTLRLDTSGLISRG